jgi:hypothetical protein
MECRVAAASGESDRESCETPHGRAGLCGQRRHRDRDRVRNDPFDLTSKPPVVGRIVTATVALVCLLIVYDGWAALKPFDVVAVIVGPVVAICTTHIFSGSLVQLVALGRRPTMKEWLVTARFELRFLS